MRGSLNSSSQTSVEEITNAAGASITAKTPGPFGWSLHSVGTARMGPDPKTSVLNQFCQAHEVPNLFVIDGSCYVSSGYVNPTLTMLAIGLRAAEWEFEEEKRRLGLDATKTRRTPFAQKGLSNLVTLWTPSRPSDARFTA